MTQRAAKPTTLRRFAGRGAQAEARGRWARGGRWAHEEDGRWAHGGSGRAKEMGAGRVGATGCWARGTGRRSARDAQAEVAGRAG